MALVRLIVTERGIPCQARASWEQSRRSRRRSDDLPGNRGKLCTGRRATGEPLKPDTATRDAERPKGEKRELESGMPGTSHVPFGEGPQDLDWQQHLAFGLLHFLHPGEKGVLSTMEPIICGR